jgi:hypothetical protein
MHADRDLPQIPPISFEYHHRPFVSEDMKTAFYRLILAAFVATLGVSCSTAYDAYGRPHTVVEPGAALLGAAAAGLIGYSLASDGHHSHHGHHYRHRGYNDCYY